MMETTVVQPKISKLNTLLSSKRWSSTMLCIKDTFIKKGIDPTVTTALRSSGGGARISFHFRRSIW
jgi:hypothetical protein